MVTIFYRLQRLVLLWLKPLNLTAEKKKKILLNVGNCPKIYIGQGKSIIFFIIPGKYHIDKIHEIYQVYKKQTLNPNDVFEAV